MDKNVVRITESELKQIVNEATQKVLSENDWYNDQNDPRWIERREKARRKRNELHGRCLYALYNIQEDIDKVIQKAEKGRFHDFSFNQLHASCYDFINTWKEIISQMQK